jgi:thioredoxin reductase (NADPH)
MENIVIIGSGPAGLTAGIYAGRAMLNPLLIAGQAMGGQAASTDEIENYPGFPEGITGPELAQLFQRQAEKFGTRIEYDTVTSVDFSKHPFKITTYGGEIEAKAAIVCTGVSPRKLGVPGEKELAGRGVSYCATCDGFFYRDKVVAVVGGGDAAVEEGLFLTRFAKQVHLIHRRNRLRANASAQKRAEQSDKMNFVWNSVVTEIIGDGRVTGIKLQNVETGEESVLPVDGVFTYIGQVPKTDLFKGQLEMDEAGFIVTDRRMHTSVPGVFAAGDVQDHVLAQVVTAAGSGAIAAMEAERFLAELEGEAYPEREHGE